MNKSKYLNIEDFDQLIQLKELPRASINDSLISAASEFTEVDELEKLILSSIVEPHITPHGPAEIVDILTLRLSYKSHYGLAGIILKGSS